MTHSPRELVRDRDPSFSPKRALLGERASLVDLASSSVRRIHAASERRDFFRQASEKLFAARFELGDALLCPSYPGSRRSDQSNGLVPLVSVWLRRTADLVERRAKRQRFEQVVCAFVWAPLVISRDSALAAERQSFG